MALGLGIGILLITLGFALIERRAHEHKLAE